MTMNALTQADKRCLERIRERHQRAATLRDIDHATPEWLTHTDRRNLLTIISRLTSCDAAPQEEGAVAVCRLCHEEATAHCTRSQCPHVTPAPTEAAWAEEWLDALTSLKLSGCFDEWEPRKEWQVDRSEAIQFLNALARVGALKGPMDRERLAKWFLTWDDDDYSPGARPNAFCYEFADALIAADSKGELSN